MKAFRRVIAALWVVCAVVSLAFAVEELLPGDPARMAAGVQARPADLARVRQQLGLDRPPLERYALFWARLIHVAPQRRDPASQRAHESCRVILTLAEHELHVDLGKSFQLRQSVVDLLASRLPRTAALAASGLFLQVFVGIALGTLAAVGRGGWIDRIVSSAGVLGVSTPTFVVAFVLQLVFARELRWLPLDGYGETWSDHARSLVLPALTLGVYGAAFYARLVRDDMIILLASDWVRTARAKGLPAWRVVVIHALRNALTLVATAIGLDFGALMGGAVVTETVFRWPGLGELSLKATLDRDGPVVCGCLLATSLAVVLANVVVDLSYPLIDPRGKPRREAATVMAKADRLSGPRGHDNR
jgi:peptide/nickel transport system permease protein